MVSKKDKYLATAQKFVERGQLDKALAEFAKVIQEDPKDTRTLLKMAELHAKRGASAEATEIYLRTGDLYAEQGFAQKAVAVYKNVLKLSPGTVAAHLKVAALFVQLDLVSDAAQQFEAAAAALQKLDKPGDAVAALRQAVDIQPDNVVLRVKLAESASQANLIDDAVREFGKAAEQLKALGRTDESLRVMERLLFHQPDNFAKARELAEAYIAKGTPRLALPKLQASLNGEPREPRTLSLLARALEQLGQVPKAVSVLKELIRLCEELGRLSERDAAVVRGLTLDPEDQELRAAAARNQLRGVAGAANEATPPPSSPRDFSVAAGGSFDLSGVVRAPTGASGASGRVSLPVGAGESSRRHDSGVTVNVGAGPDATRILAEGDIFVKYGLLERAADHLARVFEFDPDHREAREKMIVVLERLGRHQGADRHREILSAQLSKTPPPVDAVHFVPAGVSLHSDSGAVHAGEEPPMDSGPSISLAIDDDDDPAANVATPPPELKPSARTNGTSARVTLETDFDAEARTGDVEEVSDVAVGSGDIEVSLDQEAAPYGPRGDLGDNDDTENTPRLTRRPRRSVASSASFDGQLLIGTDDDDDEDPTSAFSQAPATIAAPPHVLATAMAAHDDDELSAELEQVSFFLDQSMIDEARALLEDLNGRFPNQPRIAAGLREVRLTEIPRAGSHDDGGGVAEDESQSSESGPTARLPSEPPIVSPTLVPPSFNQRPIRPDATPPPRAVVRDGSASDSETHADLAIAYKGMGLFDAAIAELKLASEDPAREVFALTTMGECFEAKGSFTEAIIRYKRALNCDNITPEETLVLYFLLGTAFEQLGDVSEALYFLEKVLKRDPKFRDVDLKVAELRPRLVKRAR